MPLTFGLADVVTSSSKEANSKERDAHEEQSVVKNLALKVLEIPLFSGIQLQRHNFDASPVYHMAGKMMQGTVQMLAHVAMKEVEESPVVEGEEDIRRNAAKVAADALRCWKGWPRAPPLQAEFDSGLVLDDIPMTDVEMATSYLASIPARTTRKHLQVKPGVV